MQLVIVTVTVLVAVAYGAWRAYKVLRHAADPCYGCTGCQLKEMHEKRACAQKKQRKKFGE